MKLGNTRLTNTDNGILSLLDLVSGVTAESIARAVYPESKQIEKKAATYTKRLRRLQRFGYAREINGAWILVGSTGRFGYGRAGA